MRVSLQNPWVVRPGRSLQSSRYAVLFAVPSKCTEKPSTPPYSLGLPDDKINRKVKITSEKKNKPAPPDVEWEAEYPQYTRSIPELEGGVVSSVVPSKDTEIPTHRTTKSGRGQNHIYLRGETTH